MKNKGKAFLKLLLFDLYAAAAAIKKPFLRASWLIVPGKHPHLNFIGAHELVHAIQSRFRFLSLPYYSALFYKESVSVYHSSRLLMGKNPATVAQMLSDLSLGSLKMLKKLLLMELQAYSLTIKHTPESPQVLEKQRKVLEQHRQLFHFAQQAERMKKGLSVKAWYQNLLQNQ